MPMYSNGGAVAWIIMSLVMLIVLGGVIWVISYAIRGRRSRGDDGLPEERSALALLEARFARGEIDEEELRKLRAAIREDPGR